MWCFFMWWFRTFLCGAREGFDDDGAGGGGAFAVVVGDTIGYFVFSWFTGVYFDAVVGGWCSVYECGVAEVVVIVVFDGDAEVVVGVAYFQGGGVVAVDGDDGWLVCSLFL